MPFFFYIQNNSFGRFESPMFVVVKAENPDEANALAESVGLYFDGCEAGIDCDCCGDRWVAASGPSEVDFISGYLEIIRRDGSIYFGVFAPDKPYVTVLGDGEKKEYTEEEFREGYPKFE